MQFNKSYNSNNYQYAYFSLSRARPLNYKKNHFAPHRLIHFHLKTTSTFTNDDLSASSINVHLTAIPTVFFSNLPSTPILLQSSLIFHCNYVTYTIAHQVGEHITMMVKVPPGIHCTFCVHIQWALIVCAEYRLSMVLVLWRLTLLSKINSVKDNKILT